MALRKIIYLPDVRLRQPNAPIHHFDDNLQTLIQDMFDTMYHAQGVGLAAPQIGINLQLSVIDVIGDKSNQIVLVNPEIIAKSGEVECSEGCLSVPSAYDKLTRAETVTVRALDRFGKPFEMTASDLLGQCFQHEIDHLNGTLFIDHLSSLKKAIARRKLDKFKRRKPASS